MVLEEATVDETGLVTIKYRVELTSTIINPGTIEIAITGQVDDADNPTQMTGTLSATLYTSSLLQDFGDMDPEISLGSNISFTVDKN
jgi:hypothetical protein